MPKASDDLKNEHDAILFTLDVLEKMALSLVKGDMVPANDLNAIIDFLKIFADKCHHGKEEGIYFPALEAAGIPRENGPIGVMLAEHETGRGYIKKMSVAITGENIEKRVFAAAADNYVQLLRSHIEKENTVLFPMGDAKLSEEKNGEILEKFEEFEETVIGKGKHEELHRMLEEFEMRYLM